MNKTTLQLLMITSTSVILCAQGVEDKRQGGEHPRRNTLSISQPFEFPKEVKEVLVRLASPIQEAIRLHAPKLFTDDMTEFQKRAIVVTLSRLKTSQAIEQSCEATFTLTDLLYAKGMINDERKACVPILLELNAPKLLKSVFHELNTYGNASFPEKMSPEGLRIILEALKKHKNPKFAEWVFDGQRESGNSLFIEDMTVHDRSHVIAAFIRDDRLIIPLCKTLKANAPILFPITMNCNDRVKVIEALCKLKNIKLIQGVVEGLKLCGEVLLPKEMNGTGRAQIIEALGRLNDPDTILGVCESLRTADLIFMDSSADDRVNFIHKISLITDSNIIRYLSQFIAAFGHVFFTKDMDNKERSRVISRLWDAGVSYHNYYKNYECLNRLSDIIRNFSKLLFPENMDGYERTRILEELIDLRSIGDKREIPTLELFPFEAYGDVLFTEIMDANSRIEVIRAVGRIREQEKTVAVCESLKRFGHILLRKQKRGADKHKIITALSNLKDPERVRVVSSSLEVCGDKLRIEGRSSVDKKHIIEAFGGIEDLSRITDICQTFDKYWNALFTREMSTDEICHSIYQFRSLKNLQTIHSVCEGLQILDNPTLSGGLIPDLGKLENAQTIVNVCNGLKICGAKILHQIPGDNIKKRKCIISSFASLNPETVIMVSDVIVSNDQFFFTDSMTYHDRSHMINILGKLGDVKIISTIGDGLKLCGSTLVPKETSTQDKSSVIYALGELKDPETIRAVCQTIKTYAAALFTERMSAQDRSYFIKALGNLKDSGKMRAVCQAIQIVGDTFFTEQMDGRDRPYIVELLRDNTDLETLNAVRNGLTMCGSTLFTEEMDGRDRSYILKVLIDLKDPKIIRSVCEVVKSYEKALFNQESKEGRASIVKVLGSLKDLTTMNAVCELIKSYGHVLLTQINDGTGVAEILEVFGSFKDLEKMKTTCEVVKRYEGILFNQERKNGRAAIIKALGSMKDLDRMNAVCKLVKTYSHVFLTQTIDGTGMAEILGAFGNMKDPETMRAVCQGLEVCGDALFFCGDPLFFCGDAQFLGTVSYLGSILQSLESIKNPENIMSVSRAIKACGHMLFLENLEGFERASIIGAFGRLENEEILKVVCEGINRYGTLLFTNERSGGYLIHILGQLKTLEKVCMACEGLRTCFLEGATERVTSPLKAFIIRALGKGESLEALQEMCKAFIPFQDALFTNEIGEYHFKILLDLTKNKTILPVCQSIMENPFWYERADIVGLLMNITNEQRQVDACHAIAKLDGPLFTQEMPWHVRISVFSLLGLISEKYDLNLYLTVESLLMDALRDSNMQFVQRIHDPILSFLLFHNIQEETRLYQEYIAAGLRLDFKEKPESPFVVYQNLMRRRGEKVDFGNLMCAYEAIEDTYVSLNPVFFAYELWKPITLQDLPKNHEGLLSYFQQKVMSTKRFMESQWGQGMPTVALARFRPYLTLSHDERGEKVPPSDTKVKFMHIVSALQEKDTDSNKGDQAEDNLSASDERFLSALGQIQGCSQGFQMGINDVYSQMQLGCLATDYELVIKGVVSQIVNEFINSGTNEFYKALCLVHKKYDVLKLEGEVVSGAHQVQYLRNLIGLHIGLEPIVRFDVHTQEIYWSILHYSSKQVLNLMYGTHFTPSYFIERFKVRFDSLPEKQRRNVQNVYCDQDSSKRIMAHPDFWMFDEDASTEEENRESDPLKGWETKGISYKAIVKILSNLGVVKATPIAPSLEPNSVPLPNPWLNG